MIETKQKDDTTPLCPHCSAAVKEIWYREIRGTFGKRYIYFCSACHKVLGISHRKGFFMG
jgi:hypothetical protein